MDEDVARPSCPEPPAPPSPPPPAAAAAAATVPYTLRELVVYFLRLGAVGFGGPIALAGYMQRDLVETRRWVAKEDYLEGLALAQLAPGPLATQLAIYLGWVRARTLGATLVGFAFVLPSFLMVLAISALYLQYGGLAWIQGMMYGVGAAVIAIIVRSAAKLTKLTLGKDRLLWSAFGVSALVTAWTESERVGVFLLSGLVVLFWRSRPRVRPLPVALGIAPWPVWLLTGLHGAVSRDTLWTVLWYFTEAGAFVFGSGLAIVPFLHGGVVDEYRWLTDTQFLDAVAVAMITPGPVVITVAFIGYLIGGVAGACAASLGVFLPCYLFVVLPAPYFRRFAKNPHLKAFVDGVTAAATGAIAGAAFVLGRRAITDLGSALLCLAVVGILFKTKKVPEPLLILAAGLVGLLLRPT